MKTIRSVLVLLLCGSATLSLALENPESYVRHLQTNDDRELQQFWETGFCQAQLDQCSTTVSNQKISFSWPTIDELLAGIAGDKSDKEEDWEDWHDDWHDDNDEPSFTWPKWLDELLSGITGIFSGNDSEGDDDWHDDWHDDSKWLYDNVAGLRQSVANLAAIDSTELTASLAKLAKPGGSEDVQLLEGALDQLTTLNPFAGFPTANLDATITFDNVFEAIVSFIERAGDLASVYFREVRDFLQFLRVVSVPPTAALGVVAVVANGLVTIVNSLIQMYGHGTGIGELSFCYPELISCTLEMIGRYLVITLLETLALSGKEKDEWH